MQESNNKILLFNSGLIQFYNNYGRYILAIILIIIIAFFLGWLLKIVVRRSLKNNLQNTSTDPTQLKFFNNAINFIILTITIVAIVYSIPDLRSLGATLFAGAGIFAAAIAFASQQAFANIVGGTFIVIFKPFRVGDVIAIRDSAGHFGVIEDITLRHTVIKNFENRRVIIPNSLISSETIINSSINDERIVSFVEFNISYESDFKKAMEILREKSKKHPLCIDARTAEEIEKDTPVVVVRTIEMGEYFVKLRANVWAKNNADAFVLRTDLYAILMERFKEEGIEIAIPRRKLIMRENNKANQ